MKSNVMCFTKQGRALALRLQASCPDMIGALYCKSSHYLQTDGLIAVWPNSVQDWVETRMHEQIPMLFIGSCGIAVRGIAPFVKHKLSDAPVLVLDEGGQFVIPLLAGHYGGANEWARLLAAKLGAIPVITTATDVNQLFAVDVFARQNDLALSDPQGIKKLSALMLEERQVTVGLDVPYAGIVPPELQLVPVGEAQLCISPYQLPGKPLLQLYPRWFVLGIGCRKGKTLEELQTFVKQQLGTLGIALEALAGIASIDRKQEEPGLIALASLWNLPFITYTKEQLQEVAGVFTASAFVKTQVGIDNVCERAALALAKEGSTLILPKQMQSGMTLAIAQKKGCVFFA